MHERQQRFHNAGEVHELDISREEEAALISQFDVVMAIEGGGSTGFAGLPSLATGGGGGSGSSAHTTRWPV